MCPACLASIAITVATSTGAGAAMSALVVRVRRSLTVGSPFELEEDGREAAEKDGDDRTRVRPPGGP